MKKASQSIWKKLNIDGTFPSTLDTTTSCDGCCLIIAEADCEKRDVIDECTIVATSNLLERRRKILPAPLNKSF